MDELKAGFRGAVLGPGEEGYDAARQVWNGMFDRRPAWIARCVDAGDVVRALAAARGDGLAVTVKGGGHNSAGTAVRDGAAMIDLSLMRRVDVDAQRKTARIDGGALLSDVDAATHPHGIAVSAGIISHTGVGGLALGGGFGWISRRHGLSVDNLLSAEVVGADGVVRRASAVEEPDLFWGIRGGGGNFGIATSLEFRCAEIGPEVFAGLVVKPFAEAKRYLQFHREYVRTLPDELTVWMVIRQAPPLPFLPSDVHGQLVVIVPFVWLGARELGEELLRPIRDLAVSHGEHMGPTPWPAWQSGFDALNAHGARNYWKSHHLKDLSDPCIDRILEFAATMPTAECEVFIPHMEGAPSRVPEEATAYAHRRVPFAMNIHTRWRDPADDELCLAWARAFHDATRPFAEGVYVNFLSEEGADRVREAYTPAIWKRLVEVKRKYDPENVFRSNQNIQPSG
ncbi:MAG: FAD-binding oxidoreductase [Chloroflexi bacterium]|nr:FAD-binding oxidoreductase [Chloroflexota bacterium]